MNILSDILINKFFNNIFAFHFEFKGKFGLVEILKVSDLAFKVALLNIVYLAINIL